jgi:hypothetical protein
MTPPRTTAEHQRMSEDTTGTAFWRRWGPYVSERSWGTVREDYSERGDAWGHLTHDMARSKAYRWGEDGLAGYCDRYQLLTFSLALWNERDPILKERAFGVVPSEGNHGEDVKEYYFYIDSTPTHSYMKYLYKYPQVEFPYRALVEENRARNGKGFEYELLDTGVFDHDRYFDVFVEFAKAAPDTTIIRIEAFNRGDQAAPLHLIPQIVFRNTWGWGPTPLQQPRIDLLKGSAETVTLRADDTGAEMLRNIPFAYSLGTFHLIGEQGALPLFTDNESNTEKLYGIPNPSAFVKDAFHRHIVNGEPCVNPAQVGTKAGLHYSYTVPARGAISLTLALTNSADPSVLRSASKTLAVRKEEADQFFTSIHPAKASQDEKLVQRQALAGLLWTKQFYYIDIHKWFDGDDPASPPPASRLGIRNGHWKHLNSMRIISMPDKWEYPWFAAWDLAFHTIALGLVDMELAKEQLWFMLFEQFLHPNGQIPAYEWEFSDLNPPVHAWAVWRLFNMDRVRTKKGDLAFLEKCFHKLLINFTWWINKVDSQGNNLFEGGFLGLDNITVLDRSEKLPGGVKLEQSDATGWMGMFCLVMMRMSLELAKTNPVYEELATKFFQHYVYVGAAMKNMGGKNVSLWDEDDGFFYDVLKYPNGDYHKFKVRSLVGIIPMYAVERIERSWIEPFGQFKKRMEWFLKNRQDIVARCCYPLQRDGDECHVLAIFDQEQLHRLIARVFDENEFLSDYGIRSLSKVHASQPFTFGNSEVRYEPAESDCKIKGGNSNWRGPIWFPTSFLLIESMKKLHKAFGRDYRKTLPDGRKLTFQEMAEEIANRMIRIFVRNERGERPVYGGCRKFQDDPHWRDYVLFYEYFHGDNGAGLGASHQTGWTGLVATLIDEWRN